MSAMLRASGSGSGGAGCSAVSLAAMKRLAFGFGVVVGECLERFGPEVMRIGVYGAADPTLNPLTVAELHLDVF